jgi:CDP-paratose 2-epimerase
MKSRILITGGAGFVGSSLAMAFREKYQEYEIICLDNLRRKGSELNLARFQSAGIRFVHGDIRNKEDFQSVGAVDFVLECSAEPSVMAGINSSVDYLINTNLVGTINCLEFAKSCGASFVFLSTSRVYPIEPIEQLLFSETENRFELTDKQLHAGVTAKGLAENFPLEGYRSFYGTTKLASELLINEYNHFYGVKSVINRCGVITGPWQMGKVDQGVVVLWLAKHFWKKKLSYIGYGGEGKQVRDILHVKDLFRLVDWEIHNLEKVNGKTLNAGGGRGVSVSLKELTALCEEITGNKIEIDKVPENRAADIRIYLTDNSKITSITGWEPLIKPKEILQDIYFWLRENEKALEPILS